MRMPGASDSPVGLSSTSPQEEARTPHRPSLNERNFLETNSRPATSRTQDAATSLANRGHGSGILIEIVIRKASLYRLIGYVGFHQSISR
jgi:hypothetical protein